MNLTTKRINLRRALFSSAALVSMFGGMIFTASSVYAHNPSNDSVPFNQGDGEWRRMELWKTNALSGTSCKDACGDGFCIGAYADRVNVEKLTPEDKTPNKNCICVGRREE